MTLLVNDVFDPGVMATILRALVKELDRQQRGPTICQNASSYYVSSYGPLPSVERPISGSVTRFSYLTLSALLSSNGGSRLHHAAAIPERAWSAPILVVHGEVSVAAEWPRTGRHRCHPACDWSLNLQTAAIQGLHRRLLFVCFRHRFLSQRTIALPNPMRLQPIPPLRFTILTLRSHARETAHLG